MNLTILMVKSNINPTGINLSHFFYSKISEHSFIFNTFVSLKEKQCEPEISTKKKL